MTTTQTFALSLSGEAHTYEPPPAWRALAPGQLVDILSDLLGYRADWLRENLHREFDKFGNATLDPTNQFGGLRLRVSSSSGKVDASAFAETDDPESWQTARLDTLCRRLASDGVDIEPGRCDTEALREHAKVIEAGSVPLHMESAPDRPAADVARDMRDVAELLDQQNRPTREEVADGLDDWTRYLPEWSGELARWGVVLSDDQGRADLLTDDDRGKVLAEATAQYLQAGSIPVGLVDLDTGERYELERRVIIPDPLATA